MLTFCSRRKNAVLGQKLDISGRCVTFVEDAEGDVLQHGVHLNFRRIIDDLTASVAKYLDPGKQLNLEYRYDVLTSFAMNFGNH